LSISSSLLRFSKRISLCCLNNFSKIYCCSSSCFFNLLNSSVSFSFLDSSYLLIPFTLTISYFLDLISCSIYLSYSFSFRLSWVANYSEFFLD
jgi:hypothetical protein